MKADDIETQESAPAGATENRAPSRACPHCSGQSQTAGGYCPHCGHPFVAPRRLSTRARRGLYAAVALLILAATGTAVILKINHDRDVKRQHKTAASQLLGHREQVEEEARNREVSEAQLERSIAGDARKLARAGVLEGPILGATCTPMSDPRAGLGPSTTSYNCIVIKRRRGRTIEGARFFASIDARTGHFTFGGD